MIKKSLSRIHWPACSRIFIFCNTKARDK